MKPYAPRRILVTTDFSDLSTLAVRHAAAWAQRYRSELVVLHTEEHPPLTGDFALANYLSEITEATREAATEELAQTVMLHVPFDVRVTRELVTGSPAHVIEEYAAAHDIDLVVLGTHGRGGLARFLMGSVAESTLRLAQHPTLIVRQPSHHPETSEMPHVRHVLCPVNYTDVARDAFAHAAAVAQRFCARLTVVFTCEAEERRHESLQCAEDRLRSWLPAEAGAEYEVHPVVRHGNAAAEVIALARETAADLVVIGAQHRRFVDTTVLGVTTVRVTRHAPCPVLVVPRSVEEARATPNSASNPHGLGS
jgi:nucleotide-binding universal stress UspA family protein